MFIRCNLIRVGSAQKSSLDNSENKNKPPGYGVRITSCNILREKNQNFPSVHDTCLHPYISLDRIYMYMSNERG